MTPCTIRWWRCLLDCAPIAAAPRSAPDLGPLAGFSSSLVPSAARGHPPSSACRSRLMSNRRARRACADRAPRLSRSDLDLGAERRHAFSAGRPGAAARAAAGRTRARPAARDQRAEHHELRAMVRTVVGRLELARLAAFDLERVADSQPPRMPRPSRIRSMVARSRTRGRSRETAVVEQRRGLTRAGVLRAARTDPAAAARHFDPELVPFRLRNRPSTSADAADRGTSPRPRRRPRHRSSTASLVRRRSRCHTRRSAGRASAQSLRTWCSPVGSSSIATALMRSSGAPVELVFRNEADSIPPV